MDLTSLKAHVREVCECASPPSEKTPRSKNFPSVEGVSQVRDGQKPTAATADTTTAMSESTLRILAFYAQDFPFTDEAHQLY